MTEIVEPHPLLIEYLEIAYNLNDEVNKNLEEFFQAGEWHYIQADIETNIFLLKRLHDACILPNEVNMCDCGIGLGTILYDLYLQSKEFDNKFTFTGIEKYKRYTDPLRTYLLKYWNDELNLIEDDIMNVDYSNWNFIYFYQPFKVQDKAIKFYLKVIEEVKPGTIIIGLNHFQVQTYGDEKLINLFNQLKCHKIDDIMVFEKI
jgi:hypothetical protein